MNNDYRAPGTWVLVSGHWSLGPSFEPRALSFFLELLQASKNFTLFPSKDFTRSILSLTFKSQIPGFWSVQPGIWNQKSGIRN